MNIAPTYHMDNIGSNKKSELQNLLSEVLHQILDDYVKLTHPKTRKDKYLYEYYLMAVDAIFDPEYRFLAMKSLIENDYLSLKEMLAIVLENDYVNESHILKLQEWVAKETIRFWTEKKMPNHPVLYIPDTICVDGLVFDIFHDEDIKKFRVDMDDKVIHMNKTSQYAQNHLLEVLIYIDVLRKDINMSSKLVSEIASGLFVNLKMNDLMRPSVVPPIEELNFSFSLPEQGPSIIPLDINEY